MQNINNWQEFINRQDIKNWAIKPSPPDILDFSLQTILKTSIPKKIPIGATLNQIVPFIKDQKNCPFCAGFSMTSIGEAYFNYIGKMPKNGFSPTFTYWMAKTLDGIPEQDGTTLRAVLKVAHKYGFCPTDLLPFIGDCSKPKITNEMLKEASKYKIKAYARLNNYDEICQAITAGKFVIVGTIVTRENWADQYILKPKGYFAGGHATFICGFNNSLTYKEDGIEYVKFLEGINSWSKNWGDNGKYWMAKDYTEFVFKDLGNMPALIEAWTIDFDDLPKPKIFVDDKGGSKKVIKMKIGEKIYYVNGEKMEMDTEPTIINGRTMVPVRFIAESLNCNVGWDGEKQEITIVQED